MLASACVPDCARRRIVVQRAHRSYRSTALAVRVEGDLRHLVRKTPRSAKNSRRSIGTSPRARKPSATPPESVSVSSALARISASRSSSSSTRMATARGARRQSAFCPASALAVGLTALEQIQQRRRTAHRPLHISFVVVRLKRAVTTSPVLPGVSRRPFSVNVIADASPAG